MPCGSSLACMACGGRWCALREALSRALPPGLVEGPELGRASALHQALHQGCTIELRSVVSLSWRSGWIAWRQLAAAAGGLQMALFWSGSTGSYCRQYMACWAMGHLLRRMLCHLQALSSMVRGSGQHALCRTLSRVFTCSFLILSPGQ